MKYHQDNRSRNRAILIGVLALFFILALLFFRRFFAENIVGSVLDESAPMLSAGNKVGEDAYVALSALRTKNSLLRELADLRRENSLLNIDSVRLSVLEAENQNLKNILGFASSSYRTLDLRNSVLADIISSVSASPYETMILSAGEDDGIAAGDLVLFGEAVVVGRIVETGRRTSKVRLLSSAGNKVSAFLGSDRSRVEIIGVGSGNFVLTLPRDQEIFEKEMVFFAEVAGSFAVAEVVEVENSSSDPSQTIRLRVPENILRMRAVRVVHQ